MYKVVAFRDSGFPNGTSIDDVFLEHARDLSGSRNPRVISTSGISFIDARVIKAIRKDLVEKLGAFSRSEIFEYIKYFKDIEHLFKNKEMSPADLSFDEKIKLEDINNLLCNQRIPKKLITILQSYYEQKMKISRHLKKYTLGELVDILEKKDLKVVNKYILDRKDEIFAGYPLNVSKFSELTFEDQMTVYNRASLMEDIEAKYVSAKRNPAITPEELASLEAEEAEFLKRAKFMNVASLELIHVIDKDMRRELMGFLSHLEPNSYIGSSILKGYFFLTRGLQVRGVDPSVLLNDIAFTKEDGQRKFLFRSTICEMFGQFIAIMGAIVEEYIFMKIGLDLNQSKLIREDLKKSGVLDDKYRIKEGFVINDKINLGLSPKFLQYRDQIIAILHQHQGLSNNQVFGIDESILTYSLESTKGLDNYLDKIAEEISKNNFNSTKSNVLKGIFGELLVGYYFKVLGWEIKGFDIVIFPEWKIGREVDLIAKKNGVVMFCEIKVWDTEKLEYFLQMFERIASQMTNEQRILKEEEIARKLGAIEVKRLGVIARKTPHHDKIPDLSKEHLGEYVQSYNCSIEGIFVVPGFLVKNLAIKHESEEQL